MDRSKLILVVLVAVAGLFGGGVIGATAASSPTPTPNAQQTPHSNETPSHESGESAAQEQAENNGTFHPGGPGGAGFNGGHPCGGHSNEDATHEKSESSSVEASENAACPPAPASPSATR
ncbi:MAG TPA: hypothetical protein VFR33_15760 [Candidatus Dormibacteraeota bacterium]|nr:hypothetical protein [Candidatus Dormibacteraeota bacterium]